MLRQSETDKFIEEEFETPATGASWVVQDVQGARRLDAARKSIEGITANSFLVDIYTEAANLRNILGDSDGIAAEISSNIRRNTLVVATTLLKKPARLVIDALSTQPTEVAIERAKEAIQTLEGYIAALSSEQRNEDNSA